MVFEETMDYDEYAITFLIKQRHAELTAEARRRSLLQYRQRSQPLRIALGAVLIRAGAWLMREPRTEGGRALPGQERVGVSRSANG